MFSPKQAGGGGGRICLQDGSFLCCAETVSSRKLKLCHFYFILIGFNSEHKPVSWDMHCFHWCAIREVTRAGGRIHPLPPAVPNSEKPGQFWVKGLNWTFLFRNYALDMTCWGQTIPHVKLTIYYRVIDQSSFCCKTTHRLFSQLKSVV